MLDKQEKMSIQQKQVFNKIDALESIESLFSDFPMRIEYKMTILDLI